MLNQRDVFGARRPDRRRPVWARYGRYPLGVLPRLVGPAPIPDPSLQEEL